MSPGTAKQVQEHDEVEPMQELRATTYTSLAQEPALTSVIAVLRQVNTSTTQTNSLKCYNKQLELLPLTGGIAPGRLSKWRQKPTAPEKATVALSEEQKEIRRL